MTDSSCEFAPELRDIERRVQDDIIDEIQAELAQLDPDLWRDISGGDFSKVLALLIAGKLASLFELRDLIPVFESIAEDHRAIVSEMEERCRNSGGEEPPPPPEGDIADAIIAENSCRAIAEFEVTSIIGEIRIERQQICISHTKSGRWPEYLAEPTEDNPDPDPMEGNPWIFAEVDGELHGGTYEHLRPGQKCKALGREPFDDTVADRLGPHIKKGPLAGWTPSPGERVGFLVSTPARNGDETRSSVSERSELVFTRWPTL